MYKLLIADKSEAFCQALAEQMRGLYEVHTCKDGMRAVELVKKIEPDVLVLDLSLSGLDGIGVLHAIQNAGYHPMVLAITYQVTNYIISVLESLCVSHMVQKPCSVLNVAARLYEFNLYLGDSNLKTWNLRDEAYTILLSLGVSLCGKNFVCIHEALVYMTEYQNRFVTKELYPAIAARCGGTPKRVEKAIRDAIEKAWKNRDERVWQLYFTYGRDGTIPCPSNGEFLSRLAFYLHRRMMAG